MKKTWILMVIIMAFSITVVAYASAGCVITWSGSRSGSITTNETSKTPQARHEAFSAIFAGDAGSSCSGPCCAEYYEDPEYGTVCLYSVPEGCDGGFFWMLGQKITRRVCDTGEWRRYFCDSHQGSGCPCSSGGCTETGSWDVICDLTSSTTTTMVTTTTTVPPTVVSLIEFDTIAGNRIVILVWSTAGEIDTAGFNIYRSNSENGEYIIINSTLIPAQGSSTQGASYEFVDKDVKNRKTYYYKLEDIDLNGNPTMHGPVSATPRWIFRILKK